MPHLQRKLLLVLLCTTATWAVTSQNASLHRAIDQIIQKEIGIDFNLVPGVLVGVIDGTHTYIESYGRKMDPDSLYEIGSVTKPFVYWLAQQVVDSLAWSVEEPACTFLPDSICTQSIQSLRLWHLLHHRSGLPLWPPALGIYEEDRNDPYQLYNPDHFAQDLMAMDVVPGHFIYSHTGYALVNGLFDAVGGLDTFSKMKFREDLLLNNTSWSSSDDAIASGYGMDGQPRPLWHCNAFQTAFGLKSTMRDMLQFVRLVSEELPIADPIDLRKTKKEVNRLSRNGEYLIRAGWFLVPFGSGVACFHTGRTGGHHISVAFVPERMKGVVVISNGALGSENLALRVLDMIQ